MRSFVPLIFLLGLLCLFCLSCAGPQLSADPIDWQGTDEDWSVHIVTLDPDGSERSTRIWLASVGDRGAFRTGDSRWWRNLQRDANCRIRSAGHDYAMRAELVSDPAEKVRIDESFSVKYGWQERLLFSQPRGETHENYGYLREAGRP
jgi:hypothetical protein